MAPGNFGATPRSGSIGRTFACMDPERRCEVPGGVLRIEPRTGAARPAPNGRLLEHLRSHRGELGMDEGGSSRHGR